MASGAGGGFFFSFLRSFGDEHTSKTPESPATGVARHRVTCAKASRRGISESDHTTGAPRQFVYQIRDLPAFCLRAPLCCAYHRFTFLVQSSPPSPPNLRPNASTNKDRCRARRILRWQVRNPPRVPYSPGSHHFQLHTGHRAVHQLVEKLPEDWRVLVIERNT